MLRRSESLIEARICVHVEFGDQDFDKYMEVIVRNMF